MEIFKSDYIFIYLFFNLYIFKYIVNYIKLDYKILFLEGIGDWGLGIGDWGLGVWANGQ